MLTPASVDASCVPSSGHRSTRSTSLPLKRGMLYYAHSRKLPVQIITTRGKEHVLSEKLLRAGYGVTLVTAFSRVIESEGAADFEAFSAEVGHCQ